GHRFRHLDAIDPGREDAAGVTGAFAGRVEAAGVDALQVVAALDADRRRGAGLDAGHHGIVHREAADLLVEGGQRFAQGGDDKGRQTEREIGPLHAGRVGRIDTARRHVGAAAGREGRRFPLPLEFDAGQGVARVIDLGRYVDDDAAVGVALGARILAHAVGHDTAGLRGGGDHGAARAHAEAVGGAAVGAVVHELVVGGAEQRMAGRGAEAGAVDQRLRVLDADADREGLGFDIDAVVEQHLEGVAGAVADGEHDMLGGDAFAAGQHHAANLAVAGGVAFDLDFLDLGPEAHFAAEFENVGAHLLDHADQPEGADVRLVDEEDFLRRAGLDEFLEHLAAVVLRVLDLAVELAVGEGAGAAFAELDVGIRVQLALAPQAPGVLGPLAHGLAAFEDDRAKAHLGQDQTGKQAAGAGTDDDRPRLEVGRGPGDELVAGVRRRLDVGIARTAAEHGGLVANLDVERVDQRDCRFFPR